MLWSLVFILINVNIITNPIVNIELGGNKQLAFEVMGIFKAIIARNTN